MLKRPEDHIASLFDMMSGLILGKFNRKYSIGEQRDFFNKHIAPWADLLMRDIESSKDSCVLFASWNYRQGIYRNRTIIVQNGCYGVAEGPCFISSNS